MTTKQLITLCAAIVLAERVNQGSGAEPEAIDAAVEVAQKIIDVTAKAVEVER